MLVKTNCKESKSNMLLKKQGHHTSSIDGIWGKGTRHPLKEFLGEEGGIKSLNDIYSTLVAKAGAPSKFVEPKRLVATKKPTTTVNTAKLTGGAKGYADYGFAPGTQQFLQCLGNLRQQR